MRYSCCVICRSHKFKHFPPPSESHIQKPSCLHSPKRFTLDGWLTRMFFGKLSSFIRRTCLSHLNFPLIIALESGIKPHFCTGYCLKYGQSVDYPKQSFGKWASLCKQNGFFGICSVLKFSSTLSFLFPWSSKSISILILALASKKSLAYLYKL